MWKGRTVEYIIKCSEEVRSGQQNYIWEKHLYMVERKNVTNKFDETL